MEPIDIFIAYSQQDKDLMEQFKKQLSAAERIGLVDSWHDGEIEVGTNRELAAQKAMEEAEIVVLLLSADFFASEYLYEKEMTQALALEKAGKATVLPVLLKECTWQLSPLAKLKILPENEIPVTNEYWQSIDRGFKQVVDTIIHTSNRIRREQGNPVLPYHPEKDTPKKKHAKIVEEQQEEKEEDKKDQTPLWKIALYAILGLGAFALVSFLTNQFYQSDPNKKDTPTTPTGQVDPSPTPKKNTTDKIKEANFSTVNISDLEWSAQNISTSTNQSWCPDGADANCTTQGRLYDYKTARNICPEGWRLPSSDEWLALSKAEINQLNLTQSGFYYRNGFMFFDQKGFYQTGEYSGGDEVWVIEYSGPGEKLIRNRRYSFAGMSCRCVR